MNLHELQRSLKGFNIEQEIVQTIENTSTAIVRNVKTQLAFGLSGTGKPLRNRFTRLTTYSLRWEVERRKRGLQVDFFDLKFTGKYTSELVVHSVTPQSYKINSRDIKEDELTDMFGDEINSMTDDSRNDYIKSDFFPELKSRIERKVGIKFG